VHGKRITIPNDGAWHKVTIDLEGLRPNAAAKLTSIIMESHQREDFVIDDIVLRSL
jgi:hypothetical protein